MPPSKLDNIYRKLLMTKFFTKGWGQPENLQRLFEFRKIVANRETCSKLISPDYPVEITKEETTSDCRILEGKFITPLEVLQPGLVPIEAQEAHFQVILPLKWKEENYKPICLHLAGTGDHFYWRRRNFIAKPLIKEANIGAILLENPFYGVRKPKDQIRSCLHNVSDIFVMGGCLILESQVLFHWAERNGLGPLGITGLSMGGHMASLAATNWPKPLVLVPCLSWSTASSVFTEGVMSQSINWDRLETQYFADGNYCERLAKMVTVVDDSFLAGQHFVKYFKQSMKELKSDISDVNTQKTEETINNYSIKELSNNNNNNNNNNFINDNNNNLEIVQINGKTSLCPKILKKLMSGDASELNQNEINKLNDKIQEIQNKLDNNDKTTTIIKIKSIDKKNNEIKETGEIKKEVNESSSTVSWSAWSTIYDGTTKLMNVILPLKTTTSSSSTVVQKDKAPSEKIDITKTNWWEREALQFMRGVMDECTHLKNFSVPYDTSLIIVVCAKDDAYVPRQSCTNLEDLWPGAEVRYLNAGHVSAYVLHQKLFRSCIKEAFERSKKKWIPYGNKTIIANDENKLDLTYYKVDNKNNVQNEKFDGVGTS